MNLQSPASMLLEQMAAFAPQRNVVPRTLAMYAAAIATADDAAMSGAIDRGITSGLDRQQYYEIVLQSYLFLGFPRMLVAVETLNRVMPNGTRPAVAQGTNEYAMHAEAGLALCKEIYGSAFDPLRTKIESSAPEVFRWMILEGYGKVMSRPGVGKVEREVCSVAFLIMEGYEKQLHSHLRGALNVGASPELLSDVIDDIGRAGGNGTVSARQILDKIGGR